MDRDSRAPVENIGNGDVCSGGLVLRPCEVTERALDCLVTVLIHGHLDEQSEVSEELIPLETGRERDLLTGTMEVSCPPLPMVYHERFTSSILSLIMEFRRRDIGGDNIESSIPVSLFPAHFLIPSLHLCVFPPSILLSDQGSDPLFLLFASRCDDTAGRCTNE